MTMLFGRKRALVGLDIGSSSVKAIQLSHSKNGYEVVGFSRHLLGPDTIVDGAIADAGAVSEAIKLAFAAGGFKAKQVATSVSGHSVIVKRVNLPVDSPDEVEGSIQFGADEYIPFEFSEVNVDYEIIGPAEAPRDGLDVLLVAAKKDQIANTTSAVTLAGRAASVVDIDAFAVQNAFEVNYNPNPQTAFALLNIGASLTNINITKAGRPLFIRDVSIGGSQYTDILQKELNLSYEEAEDLKFGKQVGMYDSEMVAPLLDSITDMLTMEIKKTFDFFKETYPDERIASIYLAGGVSKAGGLPERIQEAFDLPTEVMDPLKTVAVNSKVSSGIQYAGPEVAVALGLALRGFDK
jgi:type IV pilus assembly protein PilM